MDKNYEVRNTLESDYEELIDWWTWHRFKAPSRIMLPDDFSDGVMISYKGENVCAGFVYRTSASAFFKCEFIVSTYKVKDKMIRHKSLLILIEALKFMCKKMGAKIIYTSLVNSNLIDKYLECDFVKGSINCVEMVYSFE